MNKEEQILEPLRELYRRDTNHRKLIALYANNFKSRGVFIRDEVNFLQQRLAFYKISTDKNLFPVKLLSIELVPSSCWFSNVRDCVNKQTWDFLRRATYKQANYRCEICGDRGDKWPVECHEIWNYQESNKFQILSGLIALCPSCHQVKHIGLAEIQGHGEQAIAHLTRINGWTAEQTNSYLETVWNIWEQRSRHSWNLNLSWLNCYDIHVNNERVKTYR